MRSVGLGRRTIAKAASAADGVVKAILLVEASVLVPLAIHHEISPGCRSGGS